MKIFLGLMIILLLTQCNQFEKKEMNEFIDGKITKIKSNENGYSLLINTSNDSIIMASIIKSDFKNNNEVLQQIGIDKQISFKGTINYSDSKSKKNHYQKKKSEQYPIISIKQIKILN
jgi:histidinol phosphatase-like enzyme